MVYDFGPQYTAIVYGVVVPGKENFVKAIEATYTDGKGPDDVLALNIFNQDVKFLPKKFFDFYKNVNHIHIVESNLQSLEGEVLDGRIRYIHLDGNDIVTVPKTFFGNARELMLVSMERNKIESLDADLFVTMPKLRWVSFAGNRIRTLPGNLFRVNVNIECLSFENNGLVTVGRELVQGLEKLKGVSFDGNVCINSAFSSKQHNVREMLTKEFTTFCAGQCNGNAASQKNIDDYEDKIEALEEAYPKCDSYGYNVFYDSKENDDEHHEHNEHHEHHDHKYGPNKPCPYAHYNPMMRY